MESEHLEESKPLLSDRMKLSIIILVAIWIVVSVILAGKIFENNIEVYKLLSTNDNYQPVTADNIPSNYHEEPQYSTSFYSGSADNYTLLKSVKDVYAYPQMDANGNIYYTNYNPRIPASANTIYKYNVVSGETTELYKNSLEKIWISGPIVSNSIYFTTTTDMEYNGGPATLNEYNLSNNQVRKVITTKPVMYGGLSYLGKSGDLDIVGSFGGDGCGGFGEINSIKDGESTKIVETGGGCVIKPNYFAYIPEKNSLLLASTTEPSGGEPDEFFKWNSLYLQNVNTGEKDIIYDLAANKENILNLTFNKDTKEIAIVEKNKLIIINPVTKETKTINYPSEINNIERGSGTIEGDILSIYSYNPKTGETLPGYKLNLKTNQVTTTPPSSSSERYNTLGEYNGVKYYSKLEN